MIGALDGDSLSASGLCQDEPCFLVERSYAINDAMAPMVMSFLAVGYARGQGDAEGNPAPAGTPLHISESREYRLSGKTRYLADVPEVLDLVSALRLALRHNPTLAACSVEVRAREAAIVQARLLPNPELEGAVENFGGADELRGFDGADVVVGLSQLLELGGKRRKRRKVAEHEKTLAEWDYRSEKLDILADAAKAFVEVLVAQEQLSLNTQLLAIAQKTVAAVSEKADAGKISPVERSRALIELAAARTDAARTSRELEAARLRLAGCWSADSAAFSRVAGEPDALIPELPPEDSLKALLSGNPDIVRWDTELARSRAGVSTARAGAVPDLSLRAQLRTFRQNGDNAFAAGASVPFPLFDRNRGRIREARARLEKTKHESNAARIAVRTALADAWRDLSAAHSEAVSLRDEILPAARATYESTELGYREGKFDFLRMLDAQRMFFTFRRRYLTSLEACHLAFIEMERITGVPIDKSIISNSNTFGDKEARKRRGRLSVVVAIAVGMVSLGTMVIQCAGGAPEKAAAEQDTHAQGHDGEGREAHGGGEPAAIRITREQVRQFGIKIAEASAGSLNRLVRAPGEIRLNEEKVAHVVAQLSGIVRDSRVQVGDTVRAGQILAILESRELAEAISAYLAAVKRERLARDLFEREERLWHKEVTSEQEYLTARQALAERSIEKNSAHQQLLALGLSTVNIYFRDDVDIYLARQLVAERLKAAEESIPEGVGMPHGLEMGPVASGMGKILAYYLEAGGLDIAEVRNLHEWVVKRDIETLPGVAKVVSQGGYLKQYEVELLPEKLLAYGLSSLDVSRAIQENNANVGAGVITRESEELIVRTVGRVSTVEEIGNIVLKSVDGKPVLVRDVETVFSGKAFRRGVAILDGEREVVLGGGYKLHRANSFKVISDLRERIDQLNETLPNDFRIVPYYDQAELVANSINTVKNALIFGLVLVSVVAFLFLGNLRNALIMVCSMPFSLLFGISVLERAGMSGDLISLGGMAIALGMIIDAAIIIVEKMQTTVTAPGNEQSAEQGILEAAQEVGRPILFAVFVISVVFLPIFSLGEIEGKMFRPLAFAVVATMAGSLIYALLIAPVFFSLLHRFDKKRSGHGPGKYLGPILDRHETAVRAAIGRPGRMLAICGVVLAAGVISFAALGREFIPSLQEGSINCYAYMNPNVALGEIQKVCADISLIAREVPEIKNVVADIGYGEVGPHMHHTNYGCITITLKPRPFWKRGRSQEQVVEALDEKLRNMLGVAIGFSQPIAHELDGLIAGAGAEVVVKIFGDDMNRLKQLAGDVEHVIAGVSGVSDLRVEQTDGQTQMQIILDDAKLARYGLNKHEVQQIVRRALTGSIAGEVFEGQQAFRILVRLDKRFQQDRDAIANLLIRGPSGERLRLGSLARIRTVTGLRQISRENTQRYISVQCNVRGRDVGTFVADARKADTTAAKSTAWEPEKVAPASEHTCDEHDGHDHGDHSHDGHGHNH